MGDTIITKVFITPVTLDLIKRAIAFFKLDVERIESVDQSYSSIVRILTLESGEILVLKVPFVRHKLERELYTLRFLEGGMPVPQVIDVWQPADDRPGALLMTLLPGKTISGKVTPALAHQLGNLLARLHTHKLDQFGDVVGGLHASEVGWWQMLKQTFHQWKPLCAAVLEPQLLLLAVDTFAKLSTNLPEPDGPCYTHFDYRPGNVLVQDGHITGLIDFESARGGSACLDFIKIRNEVWDTAPECRQPFLEGYRSVRKLPDIDSTLPFYMLYNAFGGVAWCVKRDKLDDPFFDENLKRLNQSLSNA